MMLARSALTIIGILAILIGIVWVGQGSGYFPYPAPSFMINQSPWIGRGVGLAVIGIAILWGARRFLS
jgi:hypothetical protein